MNFTNMFSEGIMYNPCEIDADRGWYMVAIYHFSKDRKCSVDFLKKLLPVTFVQGVREVNMKIGSPDPPKRRGYETSIAYLLMPRRYRRVKNVDFTMKKIYMEKFWNPPKKN